MKMTKRMLSLFTALALCAALLPASAQYGIEGAWQAYGAYGTATMIFGTTGAYIAFAPTLQSGTSATAGLWQGNGMTLDAGVYSIQGMYVSVTNHAGMNTWWRYSMTGNMMYLLHEQSGIYFNLTRVSLPAPAGMGGEWVDTGGEFSLTVSDDCSFIQTGTDGTRYQGVWMADSNYLTLSYDDGDAYLLRYELDATSLRLFDSETNEQIGTLERPASVETAVPPATPAPKFVGPAVVTPPPSATEAPGPQTEEPAPDWLTGATPEPEQQTEEPAPDWLADATPEPAPEVTEAAPEPAPQTDAPAPEWLTGATAEPAAEATEAPAPEPAPQTEEPAPDIAAAPTEAPYVAPGLAGKWQAKDAAGTRIILLTPEGAIDITYAEAELAGRAKKGTFTSSSDSIQVLYEDGAEESFRYILMGDSLLLSDENLQNPVTYARQAAQD